MKKKEMLDLLRSARDNATESAVTFKGNPNPQVVAMFNRAESEASAFQAVIMALMGDACILRILARKKGEYNV
jgi:hypothetical protein